MNAVSQRLRAIPDDAPASAFAPGPLGAYRRGFEDALYDHCWFCPYPPGSAAANEYGAGHAAATARREEQGKQWTR